MWSGELTSGGGVRYALEHIESKWHMRVPGRGGVVPMVQRAVRSRCWLPEAQVQAGVRSMAAPNLWLKARN